MKRVTLSDVKREVARNTAAVRRLKNEITKMREATGDLTRGVDRGRAAVDAYAEAMIFLQEQGLMDAYVRWVLARQGGAR